jgi:GNAT superfamily N-acetyltransferase
VAAVFRAATLAAWAPFVGAERLRDAPDDSEAWADRIQAAGDGFLVAEDAAGVVGFVLWRKAPDDDLGPVEAGELDLLYTLPRAWGLGIGRRLLERATFAMLASGFREAVLWTEYRNTRALAVYERNGWVRDGVVKDRDYLGVPVRNVRHRLDLARHAGGANALT